MKPQSSLRILYIVFDDGPSATVRALVFQNAYRSRGYRVQYLRLYSAWLADLIRVTKRHPFLAMLGLGLRTAQRVFRFVAKLWALLIARRCDGVVVLKWATPVFLARLRRRCPGPILYDFDDALWLDAFIGRDAFAGVVAAADYVTCDNEILADHARRYNTNVSVVVGPPQLEAFVPSGRGHSHASSNRTVLGWVGGPSTLFYLYAILDALETVAERFPDVELVLLGCGVDASRIPPFERLPVRTVADYDQATMLQVVPTFDIGLFPLFNNDMSRGRGSLKARVYLSAGVPVIASALGENLRAVRHGVTGFLVSTTAEWVEALSVLIGDTKLRHRMGAAGRAEMEAHYSIEDAFGQLERAFLSHLR